MRKIICWAVLAVGAVGCLTTTPPETSDWPVEAVAAGARSAKIRPGALRLTSIGVRAPYDTRSLTVRRANGSLAFDPYNRFAATPSQLLRGPALDLLAASGVSKTVVGPGSLVPATLSVEVDVSDFSLDCREEGRRRATVKLALRLVDRTQGLVASSVGSGSADAASGDYGAAFSAAFSEAFTSAVARL